MSPRRTRQLDAVLEALRALDHPTAADVHTAVRRNVPRVSLGTIYRNLEKLMAAGRVVAVRLHGKPTRYDDTVAPHDHFVCESCGKITDLFAGIEPEVDTEALARAGYLVRARTLGVFGLCNGCVAVASDVRHG